MQKPTLYIMCGLPFSGKSELAKKLADHFNWDIVEIDTIKSQLGFRDIWKAMKPDDWQKIFDISFQPITHSLKQGKSVIHDSTNQTKIARDTLRKIAQEMGCKSSVVYLDISFDEAKKRWKKNRITKQRMDLPKWAFDAACDNFESPVNEKNAIIIYQDCDDNKLFSKFI